MAKTAIGVLNFFNEGTYLVNIINGQSTVHI